MNLTTDATQLEEDIEASHQHLLFTLGQESYAVHIARVREITELASITTVPMMPPHLRGVINLRGRVLPVVDLSSRFGRGPTETGRRTSIVVVELERNEPGKEPPLVGVLVNAVTEVTDLPPDVLSPPPSFGAAIRDVFIKALARHKDGFVVVLDLSRVLSIEELRALSPTH